MQMNRQFSATAIPATLAMIATSLYRVSCAEILTIMEIAILTSRRTSQPVFSGSFPLHSARPSLSISLPSPFTLYFPRRECWCATRAAGY